MEGLEAATSRREERPTSRLAFENAYGGTPTWDVGHAQDAVVRLAREGWIAGSVLDVGCGTGENALHLAELGHAVTGLDFSPTAIATAKRKAAERGIEASFLVGDALSLASLGRSFDAALDVGLFHSLQRAEWQDYASSLASAVRPSGHCLLLCWSDRNPFGRGPARVSRRDIREAFARDWRVEAIEPDKLETRLPEGVVEAWLARLIRR